MATEAEVNRIGRAHSPNANVEAEYFNGELFGEQRYLASKAVERPADESGI